MIPHPTALNQLVQENKSELLNIQCKLLQSLTTSIRDLKKKDMHLGKTGRCVAGGGK